MATPPRNDMKTVETALTYVFRLVEELDLSTDPYGILYDPEVLLWVVEQLNPDILRKLQQNNLNDVFRRRLVQFGELRKVATSELFLEYSPPYSWAVPSQWPSLRYVAAVLDSSTWRPTDRSAVPSIRRALRDACETPGLGEEIDKALRTREHAFDTKVHPRVALIDANTPSIDVTNGKHTGLLFEALAHGQRLLVTGDDGAYRDYWDSSQVSVVLGWVEDEAPSRLQAIGESRQREELERLLSCYIGRMAEIATVCNRLGNAVISLLLTSDVATALQILDHAIRVYTRGTNSFKGSASQVLTMLQRHNRAAKDNSHSEPKTGSTIETSDAIDAIRIHELAQGACFIVRQDQLPASLKELTDEKWCLAVTLPEEMRKHLHELCVDSFYLDCFFTKVVSVTDSFQLRLAVNPTFWCDIDALWPMLDRFRGRLPVLYVFDDDCVLVAHRFNACVEMDSISQVSNKHRPTVSITEDDWSQWLCANSLPPGSRLKPRILDQVIEL